MKVILELSYIAILPVLATVILYLLDKDTTHDMVSGWLEEKTSGKLKLWDGKYSFANLSYRTKQIIYGVIFGGLAVISTEFGVDVGGAAANVRDASVLTAGLVFGSPAGIIAGVIGAVERYLCVLWGGGTYTRLACSLSTLMAGLGGAVLRKHMFDDKKPSVSYALAIGLVSEVFHMLMIFITNMRDIATAFSFVEKCSIPMITVNGIAVMLAVLSVTLLAKERVTEYRKLRKHIAVLAQQWLLNCVIAAFLITCLFTSALQVGIANSNADELLRLNIDDIVSDISDASDRNLLTLTDKVAGKLANNKDLDAIAADNDIAEIVVVDENGIITDCTNEEFIGYDMASGEQSAEFLVLLDGKRSYVQTYQPISYDKSISRKFAGVALPFGGFVQVGYDADQFQNDIAREVSNATANRHIGKSGYLLIANQHGVIVSGEHSGKTLSKAGITINGSIPEGVRFRTEVFGVPCYAMYRLKEGYSVISVLPKDEAVFTRDLSIYMIVFMEIVIFVGLFILIYFLIKRLVVDNIRSVNDSLAEITGGNLNVTVDVRSNEEFASLSDDINATVDTLKQYIAEAAARIDRELEVAKVIQESSLPSEFPAFPERGDIDIFASMTAAKEVGGDFYDFYFLDDDRLAFLIADVSGKGITAAMFMMKAKALIKGFAERYGDAAETLKRANNALCEGNEAEMFVTCFMGILDIRSGRIEYTNAGHNPPLVRHKDGSYEYFKCRPGFVLAGMADIPYRKGEMDFAAGDTIFLYTDGVTEATDSANTLYGEERLCSILNSTGAEKTEEICRAVKADVDAFVGEAPQFDDITMLCIKLNENK